jgi:hypothetical protein
MAEFGGNQACFLDLINSLFNIMATFTNLRYHQSGRA